MTDAELRDKYYSEEVRPVQKPPTYPNLNGGEKNRSFFTCKVKPEAQKTTGHVETRGKTRGNARLTAFVSLSAMKLQEKCFCCLGKCIK